MKVILLKNVPSLGRAGEVKEASEGYARNFLLPKNMAVLATEKALGELEKAKKEEQGRGEKRIKLLKKSAKEINGKIFEIKMKTHLRSDPLRQRVSVASKIGTLASLELRRSGSARQAGERGRLFGSVTSKIISDKLKSAGYQITSADIILEQPIKETGEYSVKIKFNEDVTADIKVVIISE